MKKVFTVEIDVNNVQTGKVKDVRYDHYLEEDSVEIEHEEQRVIILRSQNSFVPTKNSS